MPRLRNRGPTLFRIRYALTALFVAVLFGTVGVPFNRRLAADGQSLRYGANSDDCRLRRSDAA